MKMHFIVVFQVLLLVCVSCRTPLEATNQETYDQTGTLFLRGSNKPFTGVLLERHFDGSLRSRKTFREGIADGPYCSWYENGKKDTEYEYDNGVRCGRWISWRQDGSKRYEVKCKQREMLNVTGYYSTGEIWSFLRYDSSNSTDRITLYDKKGKLVSDGTESTRWTDVRDRDKTRNGTFCNKRYTVLVIESYSNGTLMACTDKAGSPLDVGQLKKNSFHDPVDFYVEEDLSEILFE